MPNLQSLDKRVTKLEELVQQILDSIGDQNKAVTEEGPDVKDKGDNKTTKED